MPIVIPEALLQGAQRATQTLAWCLQITRQDGSVYRWTTAEMDIEISSDERVNGTYTTAPGFDVSSIVSTAGFAVDNAEITQLEDGTVFTRAALLAGEWDCAEWILFVCDYWEYGDTGVAIVKRGRTGMHKSQRGRNVIELRDLRQGLQGEISPVMQSTCRAELGDGRCLKDLSLFNVITTVTGVTSAWQFTASSLSQDAGWFTEGVLTWNSGDNANISVKVRKHSAGGVFLLGAPMVRPISVGDEFIVFAGCTKRAMEDCRDKFDNLLNFRGEYEKPSTDSTVVSEE